MSKLRVAILGCGMMSGAHARRFKSNEDVEIVALCDSSKEQIESLMKRLLSDCSPTPKFYTDPAAMYAEAALDAVAIVTPHVLHFDHAVQALDADCHVLLEKPMVTTTDHAYALAQKVKDTGKVLVVCYNTPFTPPFGYIRDSVRGGTYGRLELVTAYLSQNWKKPTSGSWRQDPSISGGGQAFDSGAHLLNGICWTVESPVAEVFAFTDNQDTDVDINSSISVRFQSGVMASIAISGNCAGDGSHGSFMFEGGRIDVDAWIGQWIRAFNSDGEVDNLPQGDGEPDPNRNFVDAILGRDEPLCGTDSGIIQAELMDAIYESARTGSPARPKRRSQ